MNDLGAIRDRRGAVAPKCCARRCRRNATQAFDVRPSWGSPPDSVRHYEVCDKHAAEYWPRGIGFMQVELSDRIKADLTPSDASTRRRMSPPKDAPNFPGSLYEGKT